VEGIVSGRRVSGWLFTLRLMYSGRDFAWLYPWADQASFVDGHVRAFEHLGGIPQRIA
jgi:transposase